MGIPERQKELEGRHAYVDGIRYEMPVNSWEASAIMAVFTCNYKAARALIPDADVHPLKYFSKALLVLTVIDYRKTDIGSYIEYSIGIACTKGRKPAPPLLPLLFQKAYGVGQFVIDLPVSSEVSVKGGRGIWGMPKHQANIDFKTGKKWISSQYDLDGKMVSRFDVKMPSKIWFPLNMGAANYCKFRGMIMRSFIYFKGKTGMHFMKPNSARFVLGDHPRSIEMSKLEHNPTPMFSAYIPSVNGVLDDYFDCWFITSKNKPEEPFSEGLEATYPLSYSEEWLEPPNRDVNFDLDKE